MLFLSCPLPRGNDAPLWVVVAAQAVGVPVRLGLHHHPSLAGLPDTKSSAHTTKQEAAPLQNKGLGDNVREEALLTCHPSRWPGTDRWARTVWQRFGSGRSRQSSPCVRQNERRILKGPVHQNNNSTIQPFEPKFRFASAGHEK